MNEERKKALSKTKPTAGPHFWLDVSEYRRSGTEIGFKVSRPTIWESRDTITKIGPRGREVRFGRAWGQFSSHWLRFCVELFRKQLEIQVWRSARPGTEIWKTSVKSTGVTGVEELKIQKKFRKELEIPYFKGTWEKVRAYKRTQSKKGTRIYWAPPGTRTDTLHMRPHLSLIICSGCGHCQLYPLCMQRTWEFWCPLPQIEGYIHHGGTRRVHEESQRSEFQTVKKGVREDEA